MFHDRFEFSGHPRNIEWYRCYDDLSSDNWIDGSELWENKDDWDEKTVAKWNFFYRPFPPAVGRPQKKMIRERQAAIQTCEADVRKAREGIAQEEESVRRALHFFAVWAVLLGMVALAFFLNEYQQLALLPVLGIGIAGWRFTNKRSLALERINQFKRSIEGSEEAIRKNESEINLLEKEISYLLSLIPVTPTSSEIQKWLNEEIGLMELACLGDFVGEDVDRESTREKHIKQNFGDERVHGLLIDSWGALQPARQAGPFGQESTGISKVQNKLKERFATWQVCDNGQPAFRVLFLQYVFPLEKNLNVCCFFYDFITRQAYGKRYEAFQYNHVTNYSIREIQSEEEPWVQNHGLHTMSNLLSNKELRAVTIAVASGNHFRCVLVDEDVVDVLNQLMKKEEKFQELDTEQWSDDELKQRFRGDADLIAEWKAKEKARMEARRKTVREKQQILHQAALSTRTMLTHVRNCIEHYIWRVQQPA